MLLLLLFVSAVIAQVPCGQQCQRSSDCVSDCAACLSGYCVDAPSQPKMVWCTRRYYFEAGCYGPYELSSSYEPYQQCSGASSCTQQSSGVWTTQNVTSEAPVGAFSWASQTWNNTGCRGDPLAMSASTVPFGSCTVAPQASAGVYQLYKCNGSLWLRAYYRDAGCRIPLGAGTTKTHEVSNCQANRAPFKGASSMSCR